jgi:hypothetical protein
LILTSMALFPCDPNGRLSSVGVEWPLLIP